MVGSLLRLRDRMPTTKPSLCVVVNDRDFPFSMHWASGIDQKRGAILLCKAHMPLDEGFDCNRGRFIRPVAIVSQDVLVNFVVTRTGARGARRFAASARFD
jgi:hypothetical protein